MITLWKWPVERREKGFVTEAACLMQRDWSC